MFEVLKLLALQLLWHLASGNISVKTTDLRRRSTAHFETDQDMLST
jgi:hypothetical protein